ncbi:hypothetical protein [Streptomyces erythrochromogenes]|uniref:hypothetical protein n=1 Tax=Streptomyces erythrochromogenes TaxID=285574 RepID=UPI0037CDF684
MSGRAHALGLAHWVTLLDALRELPGQGMWRLDRTADDGAYQDAARGRVDLEPTYRGKIKAKVQANLQEGRHAPARRSR